MEVAEAVVPAVAVRLAVIPSRLRIVGHGLANAPGRPFVPTLRDAFVTAVHRGNKYG